MLIATMPKIPNGASLMINLTICVTPSLISLNTFLVSGVAYLIAMPPPIAQVIMPI